MEYLVRKIESSRAKIYIRKNHYSKSCHNGPSPCYGLFDCCDKLLGVLCFATPCSENVRRWSGLDVDATVELHRLFVEDGTPTNTESFFIAKCLRLLRRDRPKTKIVVSFADTTEGHYGTIYKASNFIETGKTGSSWFYRDGSGSLRHPRQNGVNITLKEATSRGWTREKRYGKIRYHYPLGHSKSEKIKLRKLILSKMAEAAA